MSETDWRTPASAEYREKRSEALKRIAQAEKNARKAQERHEELVRALNDLDAGARAFGLDVLLKAADGSLVALEMKQSHGRTASTAGDGPSAKSIILAELGEAYPSGLKAAELRQAIEHQLNRAVHYKTAGMTLYRLKDAGEVERDGMRWRLASPVASTAPESVADAVELGFSEEHEPDWDWDRFREDLNMDSE